MNIEDVLYTRNYRTYTKVSVRLRSVR